MISGSEAAKAGASQEKEARPASKLQQSTSKEQMRTVDKIIMNVLQKVTFRLEFHSYCCPAG